MNRQAAPQRPPNLGPNPGASSSAMGGPFRTPYPNYGAPPRNMYPAMPPNSQQPQQSQSQRSGLLSPQHQAASNYLRGQQSSVYPFGNTGSLLQPLQQQQQHQQQLGSNALFSQSQTQPQSQTQSQQPQQQQPRAAPIGSGVIGPVGSNSETGLDPNDFPALGTGAGAAQSGAANNNASSYASQAQAASLPATQQQQQQNAGSHQRDFTAEDFPALSNPTQGQDPSSNGFSLSNDQPISRLSMLTGGPPQQQPGLLNLSGHGRITGGVFQGDDKRPQNSHPWTSPQQSAATAGNAAPPPGLTNGGFPQSNSGSDLNHSSLPLAQQHQQQNITPGSMEPSASQTQHPQTPAQQILMSPADRWGLLGLLAMIKSTDQDASLLSIGADLGTMGLDMQQPGSLYSKFITPWTDSSAANVVEPEFTLSHHYNVHPPAPGPTKAAAFSDETLFFMFYASPRDVLQELAAQELWNRNWRYHKDYKIWITKDTSDPHLPSTKVHGGEQGSFVYWDVERWQKDRKDMLCLYAELEEKTPLNAQQQLHLQNPSLAQQPQQRVPYMPMGV